MKRTVIKIDEELCNGCGLCVEGCHEGALQLIDGKAVMISELYCDGLGACIGECPVGAIELEEREAEPYDERAVMERLIQKGEKVVRAHLAHLHDEKQDELLQTGLAFLQEKGKAWTFDFREKKSQPTACGGGCPGSQPKSFAQAPVGKITFGQAAPPSSALQQWPIQLHLLSPHAPYLKDADLLLAADCVAFSVGNFHQQHLKGKRLAIACPKLDHDKQVYVDKLTSMIDDSGIRSLTVMIMEVPCCSGLLQIARMACEKALRKINIQLVVVGLQGDILEETMVH